MAMTTREAFERGTDTFNAHDLAGFAEVLADDVVFNAPGGMRGEGKAACVEFYGGWFGAFPDAHVEVHGLHIIDDVAVEEGTFTGTQDGVLHGPRATSRRPAAPSGSTTSRCSASAMAPHVSFNLMFDRLADARAARARPRAGARGLRVRSSSRRQRDMTLLA